MVGNKQSVDEGLEPPPLSSLTDTNPRNGSFPGATWDLKKKNHGSYTQSAIYSYVNDMQSQEERANYPALQGGGM